MAWKTAHHMKSHAYGVVIEGARESECRLFLSKVTLVAKDKWLCSQARAVISRVVDYFVWMKMHSGGRCPLKRTSEATGQ